jgi:hypothetical protein
LTTAISRSFSAKIIFPAPVSQNNSRVDYYTGYLGEKERTLPGINGLRTAPSGFFQPGLCIKTRALPFPLLSLKTSLLLIKKIPGQNTALFSGFYSLWRFSLFLSDFGGNPPYDRMFKTAQLCFKHHLKNASYLLNHNIS